MPTTLTGSDVTVAGTVGEFTLTRIQVPGYQYHYGGEQGAGDFFLQAKDGSSSYLIAESVGTVHFADGQYLALKDLSAYIRGDPTLASGTSQDDLLYQTRISGYEAFQGSVGDDTVYLNGNAHDYTLRPFTSGYGSPGAPIESSSYNHISGQELIGINGSGRLLIDSSVEHIVFRDGSETDFSNLAGTVAPDAIRSVDHLAIGYDIDGGLETFGNSAPYKGQYEATEYRGDPSTSALLNGNVGDYILSRSAFSGEFVLTSTTGNEGLDALIEESVGHVTFGNGQYLALPDLPFYMKGSGVLSTGTEHNDILITPLSGDQYLVGGSGIDDAYIHGNTRDYTLAPVRLPATSSHPAITGYELQANNGSGDIYVDQTTETVHFQDGQYLAFADLPYFIPGALGM